MLALTLKEVAELAGGRLDGDPDIVVRGVGTDTRRLPAGALFVALAGERADGHEFLAGALGAAAALVREGAMVPAGMGVVRVGDTLVGLRRLATGVRARLSAAVVAITGSSGKTCTKDFTTAVLAATRRVVASPASYNNEIGVPLTVLEAGQDTEVIVAEVGARGRGHIAALMPVLLPDIAVVTNVGVAHLGMFGSVEAIAEAKAELVDAVGPDGAAVLNADDERVASMAARCAGVVLTFGTNPGAEIRAANLATDEDARARFTLETPRGEARVALGTPGEHLVHDALAAAAVGHRFGATPAGMAASLAAVRAPAGRMQVRDAAGGWRVVDDSYNANPASTTAALRALAAMGRGRRTWAVLGFMAELGGISRDEHERIGALAARLDIGRLVTVGEEALPLHEGALREGLPEARATFVTDVDAAVAVVRAEAAGGDVVLVKASRAAGLERVVAGIVS
jgi:UDP-N-acetylmuramoyl-tripeptide--D-alanyl-D-alanine ligase